MKTNLKMDLKNMFAAAAIFFAAPSLFAGAEVYTYLKSCSASSSLGIIDFSVWENASERALMFRIAGEQFLVDDLMIAEARKILGSNEQGAVRANGSNRMVNKYVARVERLGIDSIKYYEDAQEKTFARLKISFKSEEQGSLQTREEEVVTNNCAP